MVHTLTCNAFGEQTYVVEHGDGGLTVVDHGMASGEERKAFQDLCDRLDASPSRCCWPTLIWTRHGMRLDEGHLRTFPETSPADRETCEQAPRVAEVYGVRMDPVLEAALDLAHGNTSHVAKWSWRCALCPATPLATWPSCATAVDTGRGRVFEAAWGGRTCQVATWPRPTSKPKSSPARIHGAVARSRWPTTVGKKSRGTRL